MNLGFFASHRGSNMQAIVNACKQGFLEATPSVVISNNKDSAALLFATREHIPCYCLNRNTHPEPANLDAAILKMLYSHNVDLVILTGYMKKIGSRTLSMYEGRILNIHPALLPKFGGKGMYGRHVHEAVLAAKEPVTGVTIHLIDAEYDTGPIVSQCQVSVSRNDTVETLAEKVLQQEHRFLVDTLKRIESREILLPALN